MLNFLSETLFASKPVVAPENMMANNIVLAQTGDVINFDFSYAEVDAELTAEQIATAAETAELNSYYQELVLGVLEMHGHAGQFVTVNTADKWAITFLRVFRKGENATKLLSKTPVFFLDAMVSDCSYWTHH